MCSILGKNEAFCCCVLVCQSKILSTAFKWVDAITIQEKQFLKISKSCWQQNKCFHGSSFLSDNAGGNVEEKFSIEQFVTQSQGNNSPMESYNSLVELNIIKPDDRQVAVLKHLQELHKILDGYSASSNNNETFFSKLFKKQSVNQSPKGLYIYGNVGTGKTMLMDLFYLCVNVDKKQRIHFNSFMLDVHSRIHKLKKDLPRNYGTKPKPYDPISPVAKQISAEISLLCFDEFQVTDIADAMILRRLFAELFASGVVMVATSNRAPDDLYKGGLQRSNFIPFIHKLKKTCLSLPIDSAIDYRLYGAPCEGKVYLLTSSDNVDGKMDDIFHYHVIKSGYTGDVIPQSRTLNVLNREVLITNCCGRIADFAFEDICMKPLGAIDYIEVAKEFDVVLIRNVPKMNIFRKTEARRFITMIDTFYDKKVGVVISAEVALNDLFAKATDEERELVLQRESIILDDLHIDQSKESLRLNVFSGEEEEFAFQRALSRLSEIQTENYWRELGSKFT